MLETIYITNPNDDTLQLNLKTSLDDHDILIFNITGLGRPKANISGLSGPAFDGTKDVFSRGDTRQVVLTLAIPVKGDDEETAREKIYEFFPIKENVEIRIITDSLDVHGIAIVESLEMNYFAKVTNAVISLFFTDPYFYDEFTSWEIYAEHNGTSQTINYEGTAPTGGVFTYIVGAPYYVSGAGAGTPYGTITIENDRNEQSFIIMYSSVDVGDRYIIDTRDGSKSLYFYDASADTMTDVSNMVYPISDWLQLYPGNNVLSTTITGTPGTAPTDRPAPANLVAYLPLNEPDYVDAVELADNKPFVMSPYDPIGFEIGHIYQVARENYAGAASGFFESGTDAELNPTANFSLMFWVYLNSKSAWGTIVSCMDGANGGFDIRHNNLGTQMQFRTKTVGGGTTFVPTTLPAVDTWACYFAWRDTGGGTINIQHNNGTPASLAAAAPGTYSSEWFVMSLDDTSDPLIGMLQGLGLYNIVLTSNNRTWLYNSGKGRTYAELTGTFELFVEYVPKYQGV